MPELPEVEVFKKYLDATSLNQRISKVEVQSGKILRNISIEKLKRGLEGRSLRSTKRHGKYLFVNLKGGQWLMFHFGMTGYLKYSRNENNLPYSRVIIRFTNGSKLIYIDQRQFGQVGLVKDVEKYIKSKKLGPDALELDMPTFKNILMKAKGSLKSAFMNQKLIAGVGNIYADEILFQSGIHPLKKAGQLDREDMKILYQKTKKVLHTAIKHWADYEQFPESYLIKGRSKKGLCPRCGSSLEQIKVTGRTTYYCPKCQRKD
ncbi:MAG TPA: DNA-formamidopyrimidine glycosylase [Thermodesulfobacteriota bacterium]|nr:DNA-formamidopyrimidine glycosylase [Thermodesulfobacteriota bacterium]